VEVVETGFAPLVLVCFIGRDVDKRMFYFRASSLQRLEEGAYRFGGREEL